MTEHGWATIAEFAEITGYGESTVRAWIAKGKLANAIIRGEKPDGTIQINLWLAYDELGTPEMRRKLQSYLREEPAQPQPVQMAVTFVVGLSLPVSVATVAAQSHTAEAKGKQ